MGVHSLWKILEPTSRAVRLESLNRKKMAVDASIWIYQFLKAVRDKNGVKMSKSHIVGFFRRICKLLYFGILPVFVFDGGAPILKRETVRKRKERRLGQRENAENTARRLLALQLQKQQNSSSKPVEEDNVEYHYLEDQDKTQEQINREKMHSFKSTDEYHLPEIKGFEYSQDDKRIISKEDESELKSIAEQIDELDGIDLNTIDPGSNEFALLPLSTQYMVLSQLRLRSRLRMGYSKEQLENIFPDSKDFSKFQIEMVQKRNYFTQRLMNISGMDTTNKVDQIKRIAGERGKSYRIQKNEGGWSLSLNDDGTEVKPIDLEKETKVKKPFENNDDSDDDVEWEDVSLDPITEKKVNYSISALPLPPAASVLDEQDIDSTVRAFSFSPNKSKKKEALDFDEDEEALKQIEEIELIEAIQKSKSDLKRQQELEQQFILESINEKSINKTNENKPIDESVFNSPFDLPEIASPNKPTSKPIKKFNLKDLKLRSEMDHILNLNSFKKEEAAEAKPKEQSKEQPTWFNQELNNPFNSNFKNDREEIKDKSDGVFVSYHEAKEIIKNKQSEDYAVEVIQDEPEVHVIESDVEEIESVEVESENVKVTELQNVEVIEVTEPENFEVSELENVEATQLGKVEITEPANFEVVEPVKKVEMEEKEKPEPPTIESDKSNEPASDENRALIDYEFYESDEERLQEQLDEEEKEHEQFQKDLNPHIIQSLVDNEIELKEQRKRELRDSDEVTQDMVKEIQELLACFGIPYITAPMEAEAQCAELLRLGLVDGIITDDSDVFLFSGDKIYKNMFHEKNYVEFYNGKDIEKDLGLNRTKFIELAHLLGSDYTEGLKGIGPVNAIEILANFENLENFKNWFNEGQFNLSIQKKENTFEQNLRKKLVKNEVILDKKFPDKRVNAAYLNPEVDHDKTQFVWGTPDLDRLRTYLMMNIGWGQEKVDEILVPLIKDLNKKRGIQSTLNEFYNVDDLNYYKKKKPNKRMTAAKDKIKSKMSNK